MTYFFADLHGNIFPLIRKIRELKKLKSKVMNYFIVLGDHGLNHFLDERDEALKKEIEEEIEKSNVSIQVILIRGNHDVHPHKIYTYEKTEMYGGIIFFESRFPDLIFLDEGDVYTIDDKNYLVYSGGHSRDWFSRILRNEYWESDEQIGDVDFVKIMERYEEKIDKSKQYCLLGHQIPRIFSPLELESEMQLKTEQHLQEIYDLYSDCLMEVKSGHYHFNRNWKCQDKEISIIYSV